MLLKGNVVMNKRTYSTSDIRRLELNSEYLGLPLQLLMENAGKAAADEIVSRFKTGSKIIIFGGPGRNGGDGMVVARHLAAMDYDVTFNLVGKENDIKDNSTISNWNSIKSLSMSIKTNIFTDSSLLTSVKANVVVDALLGTGVKGNLRQPILRAVECINTSEGFKVSIDMPSGLDADTGQILGNYVNPDLIITFHGMKKGLSKFRNVVEIKVKKIGIPLEAELFAGPGDVESINKNRPLESHKGDFGKLLVVGGSETYSGAPILVALAALRAGVDLAYIAAPEKTAYAISSTTPNLITIKLEGTHLNLNNMSQIRQFLEKVTALVIGPGLGLHPETKKAVREIVVAAEETGTPVLLDADGLKAFAEFQRPLRVPLVLTPHVGEFSILTGKELSSTLEERVEKVKKTAAKLNGVILLKSSADIVSDGERVKLNFTGNPGMTVGGTGDVLSGVVGAFLAQGANPFEAAVAGAFVNGAAGDFVRSERGYHMMATDLLDWIPRVIDDPMAHLRVRKGAP